MRLEILCLDPVENMKKMWTSAILLTSGNSSKGQSCEYIGPCGLVCRNQDGNPNIQVTPIDEEKTSVYQWRKWRGKKKGLVLRPTTLARREWVAAADFG